MPTESVQSRGPRGTGRSAGKDVAVKIAGGRDYSWTTRAAGDLLGGDEASLDGSRKRDWEGEGEGEEEVDVPVNPEEQEWVGDGGMGEAPTMQYIEHILPPGTSNNRKKKEKQWQVWKEEIHAVTDLYLELLEATERFRKLPQALAACGCGTVTRTLDIYAIHMYRESLLLLMTLQPLMYDFC